MGFFKRKLEDEEESEIKDLKPHNKKVRKEPPKPWGKFERLVVLFTLLFTVITAVVLILYSQGLRLPKFNFDLSHFNIFESETIIITNE